MAREHPTATLEDLRRLDLLVRLRIAEQAVDGPFDPVASLGIDALVDALEERTDE